MRIGELIDLNKKQTGSFYRGFISPFTAFRVMSGKKGFAKYFIIPFILNLLLLCGIFYLAYSSLHPWLMGFLEGDSWIFSALRVLMTPILTMLLGIITILIYSITGNIITAPFNDYISLKVEEADGEVFNEKFSLGSAIKDIIRIALNIVKLLLLMVLFNLILLLLNLIPVVGSLVYSVLSFMLTAFFLGFQFFDFPLERRRLVFGEKLRITLRYKFMVIGLGMSFFILAFIPIVGFLILNLAAVGATSLFSEHIKPVLLVKQGTDEAG